MARTVDLAGVKELLDRGGQLVEVLPYEEYQELHLPGAIHLPLKELDARRAKRLDRERPVVVYCWDALCDMSPRAATRLEQFGFEVYDYAHRKIVGRPPARPREAPAPPGPPALPSPRHDVVTCALDDV